MVLQQCLEAFITGRR